MTPLDALAERYAQLDDPRMARTRRHSLRDLLLILTCALLCGADDLVAVQEWGDSQREWVRKQFGIEEIPSHDTFGRVLSALDPVAFSECFLSWAGEVTRRTPKEVIALDGKTLRGSRDATSRQGLLTMVSAFAVESGLVLGQQRVADGSNEITALPELLSLLDLSEAIVTIDAIGCQKEIARQIVAGGGDYVLALKENQKELHREVEEYFEEALATQFGGITHGVAESRSYEHGRTERRRCYTVEEPQWLSGKKEWPKLTSLVMVESRRQVGDQTPTVKRRYFISSLPGGGAKAAEQALRAVRSHWGIENTLHWVLDLQMREDESRVRKDHAPANLATARHVAINLLRQETTARIGIKNKRLRAGWDTSYLEKVLRI